jgi:hypothetical protein
VETAHQSLTAIDCDFIVCCVDRPKLLEHRGYKYCQVPFGDAPSAQAELREKMAATYSFIDNARWVQSLACIPPPPAPLPARRQWQWPLRRCIRYTICR